MTKKTYKRRMARAWKSLVVYNDDDLGYRKVKSGKPVSGKAMKKILAGGIYNAINKESNNVGEVQNIIHYPIRDNGMYVLMAEEYMECMYFIWPQKVG